MTISTQISSQTFPGNGVTVAFPCGFRIFDDTDVIVSLIDPVAGTSTPLVLNSDYTIAGAGDQSGFTLSTTNPVASGINLLVSRDIAYEQPTDFTNQGSFFPTMHEDTADRTVMQVQQVNHQIGLALTMPDGLSPSPSSKLPFPLPGSLIGWSEDGLSIVNLGPSGLGAGSIFDANVSISAGIQGSKINFVQAGSGAVTMAQQTKSRQIVALQDFGGADDNSTDNTTPVNRALTLLSGGTVKLPYKMAGGAYKFNTASTNLSGVVFDPDQGVIFQATESTLPLSLTSGIRTTRNIRLYMSNLNYNYQLSSQMGKPFDAKTLFLSDATAVHPTLIGLNLGGLINESNPWPNSDTWTSASPSITTTEPYPFVNWSGLSASTWYMSTLPVRGGDEITGSFDTPGTYNRVAMVRTSTGYYGLYAPGGGAAPIFFQKVTGSTGTSSTVASGTQFTTQPQYYAETATWTIRIIDRRHFEVLLNGVAALTVATTTDIFRAGFGVMQTGGATSMSVTGWVKTQLAPVAGRQPVSVICYGDSLTADIHGGWPYAMREALDGSNGCRVMNVNNQAVSGYTSTQALSLMQSVGVAGYNYCVIGVGTNDIQQGFTPQATINNINAMVAICNAANVVPILWIPPLWYTQTEAGAGTGQASTAAAAGSPIRATILRYCAVNSVACVDLTMVTGPVDVRFLKSTGGVSNADPMVRDNIHPTAYAYRLIGNAIARRILGLMVPALDRSVVFQQLNPPMLNSWTDVTSGSRISYATSHDGKVTLAGVVTAGTKTDGTAIFAVPENLRPSSTMRFAVLMNQTVAPNYTSALVQIDTAGNLTVYGVTNANYISLDNISYYSAG